MVIQHPEMLKCLYYYFIITWKKKIFPLQLDTVILRLTTCCETLLKIWCFLSTAVQTVVVEEVLKSCTPVKEAVPRWENTA